MKHVIGMCKVGQHVNKTGYIIIPFRSVGNPCSPFYMGEPIISISNAEMATNGLAIILGRLCNPAGDEFKEISFQDESTKKRMLKLKRDHLFVSVELLRDGQDEIKIIPLHGERGWQFNRRLEEIKLFGVPKSNDEFVNLLNDALDIAS